MAIIVRVLLDLIIMKIASSSSDHRIIQSTLWNMTSTGSTGIRVALRRRRAGRIAIGSRSIPFWTGETGSFARVLPSTA